MCISRCVPLGPFLTLVLTASGACAHGSNASAPSPTRTFQTIDAAKACAREALISVGFLPETGTNPNSAGEITRAETATSINSQLITPLPAGKQVDYATAGARVQLGPKGDTTVTVGVTVQTLSYGTTRTSGPCGRSRAPRCGRAMPSRPGVSWFREPEPQALSPAADAGLGRRT